MKGKSGNSNLASSSSTSSSSSRRFNWGGDDDDMDDERTQLFSKRNYENNTKRSSSSLPTTLAPSEEYERQARDIEELGGHVSAISEMSGQISSMILESHRDLDELNEGMERSKTVIEGLTVRTNKMVNYAGGPRYCCIIMVLSGIALFLFMLVLYT